MTQQSPDTKNTTNNRPKARHASFRFAQRFSASEKIFLISVVVVLSALLTTAVSYLSRADVKVVDVQNSDQISKSDRVLTSHQIASSDAYTIAIGSVTENDKKDPAFTISESETMLIADITITNNSAHTQDLLPSTQLYVRSREGSTYGMHPSVYVTSPLQAEKVLPGQTIQGQVSFAVPKILDRPLLYIDLGWDNYVPVVYDILH